MRSSLPRLLLVAALLLVATFGVAACTAPGSNNLDDPPSEPIDTEKGRKLFQTSCRICHNLADAKAAAVFGPDLDLLQPDATVVRKAIDEGPGPMPDDLLTGDDADLVSRYVAQVAGNQLEREGEGGTRGGAKPAQDQ